ncbi:MAG: group II intron reverse transcriptase domain-containing protein [Anaerolineae bacterium]|nr:group II intron reverse transcriptase domain-containing protein [Anaerolineae bacterium]
MSSMFASIYAWENLLQAYRKAAKGKRGLPPAACFEHQIADHLLELQEELRVRVYQPGAYTHFFIHEPKRRKISAAPFRDRVVHHALCNVIEPLFEARFIPDSYANRVGKGTHRALDRLQALARAYPYVLRLDVVQHFPSLDHAVLRAVLENVISDTETLWLADRILNSGAGVLRDEYTLVSFPGDEPTAAERPRGLPIGNLTSQFWSNAYMDSLDWFVVSVLRCPAYLRYVDDFALFSRSKRELYSWKAAIIGKLTELRLTIHQESAQVMPCHVGVPWLGFIVYPTHRLLKRRNAVSFSRRLERNIDLYESGRISFAELDATVQGWINHVRYADTWGLRRQIFDSHPIRAPQKPSFEGHAVQHLKGSTKG